MAEDLVQETKTTQPTPMEAAQSDAAAKATQYTTTEYKVLPLVFMGEAENDFVIGFYKEPSRQAKLSLLDRIYVGAAMSAAADIFDACFMPEVSDTRIQSDDKYYFGACKAINNHILVAVDQYKKKIDKYEIVDGDGWGEKTALIAFYWKMKPDEVAALTDDQFFQLNGWLEAALRKIGYMQ